VVTKMPFTVKAVYRNGKFVPEAACDIPEGTEVELTVRVARCSPPTVTDPTERDRILSALTKSMKKNPIPLAAPRFSRDELHQRGSY